MAENSYFRNGLGADPTSVDADNIIFNGGALTYDDRHTFIATRGLR